MPEGISSMGQSGKHTGSNLIERIVAENSGLYIGGKSNLHTGGTVAGYIV